MFARPRSYALGRTKTVGDVDAAPAACEVLPRFTTEPLQLPFARPLPPTRKLSVAVRPLPEPSSRLSPLRLGAMSVMLPTMARLLASGTPRFPMFADVPVGDSAPLSNDTLPSARMLLSNPSPSFV